MLEFQQQDEVMQNRSDATGHRDELEITGRGHERNAYVYRNRHADESNQRENLK